MCIICLCAGFPHWALSSPHHSFVLALTYRSDGSADQEVPSSSPPCIAKERRIGPTVLARNLCIRLQCLKVIRLTVLCIIYLKGVIIWSVCGYVALVMYRSCWKKKSRGITLGSDLRQVLSRLQVVRLWHLSRDATVVVFWLGCYNRWYQSRDRIPEDK